MALQRNDNSNGSTSYELDAYTDAAVCEATARLAPAYDDLEELTVAVLTELYGVQGFEEGEDELIAAVVDAIAPELTRGPAYFERLAAEDAARAAWPPKQSARAQLDELFAMQAAMLRELAPSERAA